jgi:hypothetical protein
LLPLCGAHAFLFLATPLLFPYAFLLLKLRLVL